MARPIPILAIVALAISACTVARPAESAPSASPPAIAAAASPTPSPSPAGPPTPTPLPTPEPLPSDLDPDIRHAIEFRRSFGLRHDLEYVLNTYDDPKAHDLMGFPWYPHEEAKFFADQAMQQEAVSVIQARAGRHRDEFGGVFIDREDDPGAVTSLWTRDLAAHEAAIRAQLPSDTSLAFGQVKYSEAHLRKLQDEIGPDWRWMESIGAAPQSLGVELLENILVMEISSANPDAPAIIEAHYGLGDKLRVESDGTGAALLPWGTVVGDVFGPNGRRLNGYHDLMVSAVSDDLGHCGGPGDIGYGVSDKGKIEYPCQVGVRTIQIQKRGAGDGEWVVIGEARARVVKGETVSVEIHLTEAP